MATEGKEKQQPQADWSAAMTKRLVTVLLDEVALGKRADTGFKAGSYERALREVNTELDSSGKISRAVTETGQKQGDQCKSPEVLSARTRRLIP
jgi:hypothetical protein